MTPQILLAASVWILAATGPVNPDTDPAWIKYRQEAAAARAQGKFVGPDSELVLDENGRPQKYVPPQAQINENDLRYMQESTYIFCAILVLMIVAQCWKNWGKTNGGFWRTYWQTGKQVFKACLVIILGIAALTALSSGAAEGIWKGVAACAPRLGFNFLGALIWSVFVPLLGTLIVWPIRALFPAVKTNT